MTPRSVAIRTITILASASCLAGPGATQPAPGDALPSDAPPIPAADVRVAVPDFGEFVIRLDRDRAPNATAAFLSLAARGQYDGTAFHRVIPGFLVQTGDPATADEDPSNDGGAPSWRLKPEFSDRPPKRGLVALAWRGTDPASAGSEWFVLLADAPRVEGHATPIGEVIEGMDVLDRISQVSTTRDRRPLKPVRIADARLEAPAPPPLAPAPADSAVAGNASLPAGGARP